MRQSGQLELDFTHRGYRRSVIQQYRCPNVTITEGRSRPVTRIMKARDLKAMLRAIDDFGVVCTASQQTIAESADCDLTHVKRCLRALKQLGLLAEVRRSRGVEYRIVFSELVVGSNSRVESELVDKTITRFDSERLSTSTTRESTDGPRASGCDRPTDRPTSGSITDGVIDPLIDPNGTCDRPTDRPTSGSTNYQQPLTTTNHLPPEGVCSANDDSANEAQWVVVVSELQELGMHQADTAVALARARLSPSDAHALIDRFRRLCETDRKADVSWLYRWLIGKSHPPDEPPAPVATGLRGDALKPTEIRAEHLRCRIFAAGRAAGASPEQIEQRLVAAGLEP